MNSPHQNILLTLHLTWHPCYCNVSIDVKVMWHLQKEEEDSIVL